LTYAPRLPPYPHQAEALARMRGCEAFALLCDTGTGKSRVPLDLWGEEVAAGGLDCLLIIAPAGCYRNWCVDKGPHEEDWCEFRKHLAPDLYAKTHVLLWRNGSSLKFKREVAAFLTNTDAPRALVVNVEALSTVKAARELCHDFLCSGRALLLCDESSRLKGWDSSRTKAVLKFAHLARRRVIMSGLVAPKSPLDLFSQFEILDWRILGYRSYYAFRGRYGVMEHKCVLPHRELLGRWSSLKPEQLTTWALGRPAGEMVERWERASMEPPPRDPRQLVHKLISMGEMTPPRDRDQLVAALLQAHKLSFREATKVVVGYQNVGELWAKIEPRVYRKLKEECLDLPPKVYQRREVAWAPDQERVYRELRDEATTQLASAHHVTATEVMVRLAKLHQVLCGHVTDEEGEAREVPTRRAEALIEVLEEHGGKVIVWAHYERCVRSLATVLREKFGENSVAQFWGGNRSTRAEDERRFLNDPECRFMVATQAAGGMGNTWVVADLVIYYANDYNLESRVQSEDRAHRIGQKKSVTYVDLMVPGTVDEKIVKSLRAKIDLAAAVTGDAWREWLV
jgi:Helicase conserved C-terminal domain